MPGSGTYTQDEVDALIAGLQKQVDLKATRGELSVHSSQNSTQIQGNINDIDTLQTKIGEQQAATADLARRLTSTHTHSFSHLFYDTGGIDTGVFTTFQPPVTITVSKIRAYHNGTSLAVNIQNAGSDMLTNNLTGAASTWLSTVPDANAGLTDTGSMSVAVLTGVGITQLTVQVDYTID